RDAAGVAHEVDGLQMMPMAARHGDAALHVDAERRTEQRLLDVVDREAVAAEHRLYVAASDEAREGRGPAGGDPPRPAHDDDLAAARPDAAHLPRDALDRQLDTPLARDRGAHEAEAVAARARRRRVRAHAVDAAHDAVAAREVAQQAAADARA